MKHIPIKAILCQLKKDLVGKDAYRGVSLTYSLLANQFGHFSLGFIPAIMRTKKFSLVLNLPILICMCVLQMIEGCWFGGEDSSVNFPIFKQTITEHKADNLQKRLQKILPGTIFNEGFSWQVLLILLKTG